jgi:U3 small nucleolar RNA-associated protein 10
LDESSQESLNNMCLEIRKVLDDDSSNNSLKVAAVSALEVLAESFPSNSSTFVACLESIIRRCNTSQNSAVTSSCLRTSAALIKVLGPKALSKLDQIMTVIKSSKDLERKTNDVSPASNAPHLVSVLVTLEAVVVKLGGFLTKDLKNIMELLVLRPEFVSGIDAKVESRATKASCGKNSSKAC